jgi:hypothetical protein
MNASMVSDAFRPGRYFWRVRTGSSWKEGSFSLETSRDAGCRSCKHTNVIDDSGENTVVYFQKTLPAITLHWSAASGAAKYHVKIFADGAFNRPVVDANVTETKLALPAGKLPENNYFWLVQSIGQDGKEIATGRINGLNITYDNAVVDIDIRTPTHLAKIASDHVLTAGEVRLGGRLSINGRAIGLDKKGRFREVLPLTKGENQIVYRTVASNGVERFYVRRVYRL